MVLRPILSFSFAGFPGVTRYLRELAAATGLIRHLSITHPDPYSSEIAFFREHLAQLRPRLTIFGGWHRAYEPLVEALLSQGLQTGICWTSSPVQTTLSSETRILAALLQDPRLQRWFFVSSEFLPAVHRLGVRAEHLPAVLARVPERPPAPSNAPPVVSLFFSPTEHRRKNALTCLLALAAIRRPFLLWTNGLALWGEEYGALVGALRLSHQDRGWLGPEQYERALAQVDVGLQVSLAESFDYVAAEHFLRGIPVLVSSMVPCADGLPEPVLNHLLIRDADDPSEIAARLAPLLEHAELRASMGEAVREHILRQNDRNIRLARQTLESVLAEGKTDE